MTIKSTILYCIVQYAAIFNLILKTEAPYESDEVSHQVSLAEYYKENGIIKWNWDSESFCASRTLDELPPTSFTRAFVRKEAVMLELADCTVIEMVALHCTYDFPDQKYETRIQQHQVYVSDNRDEIFNIGKPEESLCNDPHTFILRSAIYGGLRKLTTRLIKLQTEEFSFITEAQISLLKFYQVNVIKFIWHPGLICPLLIPNGFSFRQEYIEIRDIMLEWMDCTKIQMEVLLCESVSEFVPLVKSELKRHYFANGPGGEIYLVGPLKHNSKCDDKSSWTIHLEILPYEDLKVSGIDNMLKIFSFTNKELRKRVWLTLEKVDSAESSSANLDKIGLQVPNRDERIRLNKNRGRQIRVRLKGI